MFIHFPMHIPKLRINSFSQWEKVPYMNAVGVLMYLAIGTCPDIAHVVGKLAQYNNEKHIFHYLKGTMGLKLTYCAEKSPILSHPFIMYSNSDHAGWLDTQRSLGGYTIKIGTEAISWSSKKQSTVTLSSTRGEYITTVAVGKRCYGCACCSRNCASMSEMGHPCLLTIGSHLPC